MELKDFGTNLAKKRIEKNISAYELSLRIGKNPSYISKAEMGLVNMPLKVISSICEVLEILPKDLLDF